MGTYLVLSFLFFINSLYCSFLVLFHISCHKIFHCSSSVNVIFLLVLLSTFGFTACPSVFPYSFFTVFGCNSLLVPLVAPPQLTLELILASPQFDMNDADFSLYV